MSKKIITGFHAIEEYVRSTASDSSKTGKVQLLYSTPGPRVKKIIAQAEKAGIVCSKVESKMLDEAVSSIPEALRDHRGIVLVAELKEGTDNTNRVSFDEFVAQAKSSVSGKKLSVVLVLDSVTDPHNVGAIIRSCDQFGVDLVVLPERRGVKDSEVIARSSAGAISWVPVAVVPNLVRAVEALKEAGYWVYGADAGGITIAESRLEGKVVLIMGSEGTGMSRLLEKECDAIVSIPTCGKLDSLNVSVAAGILLYEIRRQNLFP
ncbi:MAG: 23S rRNA (guanosine(2251)-2'-O)-methyltransferase RlmB [Treponemataceae bacterium]|nr:23S rRNA (guanosine(2251)-2'-O)-methyltransferase RlmB [Treponemataceae bacterium]